MRVWVIEEHGKPEVFKEVERPTPTPGPGEVRIKVAATSVNPIDYKIRSGVAEALCPTKPAILHGDVSGVIDAVGDGVRDWKIGDAVFGCIGGVDGTQGALADYAIADKDLIAHAPAAVPLADAAAMPLVYLTAYEGLCELNLQGAHILIHGGAGGVGHMALQLAKAWGADVSVTVSNDEKAQVAKRLGADHTINYQKESVEAYTHRLTLGVGFDVVFDTVGKGHIAKSIEAVKHNGTVVCTQSRGAIDGSLLHAKGVRSVAVFMLIPLLHGIHREAHSQALMGLAEMTGFEEIKPLIDNKRFTFDQIAKAHAYAESGKQIGKVLVVHPDHQ